MKRFLKVLLPILLSGVIIAGICWYFLSYDKGLTQDVLRSCGSYFAGRQQMKTAAWFYDLAYKQDYDPDSVAIELAENIYKLETTPKQKPLCIRLYKTAVMFRSILH